MINGMVLKKRILSTALTASLIAGALFAFPLTSAQNGSGDIYAHAAEGPSFINYGGSRSETLTSAVYAPGGGIVSAGYTNSTDKGFPSQDDNGNDMIIAKSDKNGNIGGSAPGSWYTRIAGSSDDRYLGITQGIGGGYVAVGRSDSDDGDIGANEGGSDMIIAKVNENGEEEWIHNYGGSHFDEFKSVMQVQSGYVAVGDSSSSDGDIAEANRGSSDMVAAKFDEGGNTVWLKTFGGDNNEGLNSVTQAPDGNYVAAGYSLSSEYNNKGSYDFFIAKLSAVDGSMMWYKNLGGRSDDIFYSVTTAAGGGYVAVGSSASRGSSMPPNNGVSDMIISKFDDNGNMLWIKAYGGNHIDEFKSVARTADGNYVAAGATLSTGGGITAKKGGADIVIGKFDGNGDKIGIKTYGGSKDDVVNSIIASQSGYAAVGLSSSGDGDIKGNNGGSDMIIGAVDEIRPDVPSNPTPDPVKPTPDPVKPAPVAPTPGGKYPVDASGRPVISQRPSPANPLDFSKLGTNAIKIADKAWTGKPVKSGLKVVVSYVVSGKVFTRNIKVGSEYTISKPGKNKNIGKGVITVTGKKGSAFTGTKALNFKIVPKKPAALKVKAGKKSLKISFKKLSKKQKVTRYKVMYRVVNAKKWKTKIIKVKLTGKSAKKKTVTVTIKKLKKGKKYQVKVFGYKGAYGGVQAKKNSKKVK
jgi:hypothetical protein